MGLSGTIVGFFLKSPLKKRLVAKLKGVKGCKIRVLKRVRHDCYV